MRFLNAFSGNVFEEVFLIIFIKISHFYNYRQKLGAVQAPWVLTKIFLRAKML